MQDCSGTSLTFRAMQTYVSHELPILILWPDNLIHYYCQVIIIITITFLTSSLDQAINVLFLRLPIPSNLMST